MTAKLNLSAKLRTQGRVLLFDYFRDGLSGVDGRSSVSRQLLVDHALNGTASFHVFCRRLAK